LIYILEKGFKSNAEKDIGHGSKIPCPVFDAFSLVLNEQTELFFY